MEPLALTGASTTKNRMMEITLFNLYDKAIQINGSSAKKGHYVCMYVYVCAFEDDDSTFAFPFTTVVESQWMAERPPRTTSCRPGDRATHCYIKRYIVVVL